MISLKENLSKLESIKITGFTDNSNFVERDYAFLSFSKNPKINGEGGGDVAAPIFSEIIETIQKL